MSKGSKLPGSTTNAAPNSGAADNPLDRVPDTFAPSEMELVWEKHKGLIVASLLLVVLLILGYNVWTYMQAQDAREATARFSNAKTAEEFKAIAQEYPNEPVGGNALLMLAAQQTEAGDNAAARATFEEFVQKFPKHELAPAGHYAIAGYLENDGKLDEALARYELVLNDYEGSFVEDAARRGKARVLTAKGNVDGAREVYQEILGKAEENSQGRATAEQELKLLNRTNETFSEIQYTEPPQSGPGNLPQIPGVPNPFPEIPGAEGMPSNGLNIQPGAGDPSVQETVQSALEAAMRNAATAEGGVEAPPEPPAPDAASPAPSSLDSTEGGSNITPEPGALPPPSDPPATVLAPPTEQETMSTDVPGQPPAEVPAATDPYTPGAPLP